MRSTLMNMDIDILFIFLGAVFLNSLLPGPGTIITINQALLRGWRSTIPLIAGQATALTLMVPIVAFSYEALRTSETTWLLLKAISVIWLIFLAYKTWRLPIITFNNSILTFTSNIQLFNWGLVTNITNAKAFAFLFATLPMVINQAQPLKQQIILLTIIMVIIDIFLMMFYAFIAVRLQPYFQSIKAIKWQNRLFSIFLLLIAISLFY